MSTATAAAPYAVVTVTFNPDLAILRAQLGTLGGAPAVLVDNASAGAVPAAIADLARARAATTFLANASNLGLAAALNQGARAALERHPDTRFLVFLDQDTEPRTGDVERLVAAAAALRERDARFGLAGPVMVDALTGLSHGVPVIRGWLWAREFPGVEAPPLRCAVVNGSGCVAPAELFTALGGFDESLFVDHVDTEWSFRVAHSGRTLYAVPGFRFAHRMGERSLRFWFGRWRLWPYRAPLRHYYIFRNVMTLMRRREVPLAWKLAAPAKLLVTLVVHVAADRARGDQWRAMLRGVRAGGSGGRAAEPAA